MENENTVLDVLDTLAPDVSPSDNAPASETGTPLEVISVDELIERLSIAGEDQSEDTFEETAAPEEAEPSLSDQWYLMALDDTSSADTVQLLTEIRDALPDDHPLLTTNFADYTVAEGLLLALSLCVVGSWCVKMLKGGFSWLLS